MSAGFALSFLLQKPKKTVGIFYVFHIEREILVLPVFGRHLGLFMLSDVNGYQSALHSVLHELKLNHN
jgi:hypothetical protein